jgi:hypothetical protein
MLTYTGSRNLYGSLTNNTSTTNLTLGDTLINQSTRKILSGYSWPFLEKTATLKTVADQNYVLLPQDCEKLYTFYVDIDDQLYQATELTNKDDFDSLGITNECSYPLYYYVFDRKLYFWPIPSTSNYDVVLTYKQRITDLDTADYTTGTVSIVDALGMTEVYGGGTTFTADMVGRYIKTTDRIWYKISAFVTETHLTIDRTYLGSDISNATYTIGQVSLIPEDFQILPVYEATMNYWAMQGEVNRAQIYKDLFDTQYKTMVVEYGSKTSKVRVDSLGLNQPDNPNLYITGT